MSYCIVAFAYVFGRPSLCPPSDI